jgi:hypothetical protein
VNELSAREKVLYHQIHPAKLGVDIGVTPVALYLFWIHSLVVALVVSLLPSVIASAIIVGAVDLSKYKESKFGRYVGRYMTRASEAVRLAGFIVAAVGAWFHLWWLIPVGIAVVMVGWLRGVILRQPQR